MSYLVLARKYRPQSFDDVVRQEHVTRTLTNAVSAGRVAHAILFSGPRGTGKTTIARILAKAMNCESGPTPSPCNECRACIEITNGNANDVFEIDGASNNGVDHIRELRENARYTPVHGRYKIYIIDEVHMLSTQAFNALLKTLEEPPEHVMFLFATTEPHKIPITILSRCQRHDLRRIDLNDIVAHMAAICEREGIAVDPESLAVIAREGGGSMRDALSLLDQVMSGVRESLSHAEVLDLLGVVDRRMLHEMAGAIFQGDLARILDILDDIHDLGHNMRELYAALTDLFRDLLVIRMGGNAAKLVELPESECRQLAALGQSLPDLYLSQILDTFVREEASIRLSANPKLALEMIFIRLFHIRPALSVEMLIQKLDDLRQGVMPGDSGGFPRRPAMAGGRSEARPLVTGRDRLTDASPKPAEKAAASKQAVDAVPPPKAQARQVATRPEPPADAAIQPPVEKTTPSAASIVVGVQKQPEAPPYQPENAETPEETYQKERSEPGPQTGDVTKIDSPQAETEAPPHAATGYSSAKIDAKTLPAEPPASVSQNAATPEAHTPPADPESAVVNKDHGDAATWERVVEKLAAESISLSSCLGNASLKQVTADAVEIEVRGGTFNRNRIEKQRGLIEQTCQDFFGRPMAIRLSLAANVQNRNEVFQERDRAQKEALEHPAVKAAFEVFNGRLVDVKILK